MDYITRDRKLNKTIMDRLARMESRIVEGFMQLGANVKVRPDERIFVDDEHKFVYIPHQGVSIGDILASLPDDMEYVYDIKCGDEIIGGIAKDPL